jgi:hypothetical protein
MTGTDVKGPAACARLGERLTKATPSPGVWCKEAHGMAVFDDVGAAQ